MRSIKNKCLSIYKESLSERVQVKFSGGFPSSSAIRNLPAYTGDVGSILELGSFLEKKMATDSSILAWRIPWTEKSGGLQSMGSQKSQNQLST